MQQFFHQIFHYNFHGNKSLMEADPNPSFSNTSTRLFNHILNAHHIWNKRLSKETVEYGVWQEHQPEFWNSMHDDNQKATFDLIEKTTDFDRHISYESSEGTEFSNTIQDILFHIINHSTHHRGQILQDMRLNGHEPKPLDYIFYKR